MSLTPVLFNQQFTSAEKLLLAALADLSYQNGDIIYYNSSTFQRLPIGSTSDVLTVAGGLPSWSAAGAAGANTALSNLASVSINTSLLAQTGVDLGSTAKPFREIFFWGTGTFGTTYMKFTGVPTSTRTWTFQDASDTVVGLATTDTLTNKTLTSPKLNENVAVTTTATKLNYLTSATGTTGTASTNIVFSTSPTLTTPSLGVATATSINGNTFTTGTYTLTGTAAKTLNFTNSLTLTGTDSTTMTFPTTSATIARTDAANTFTGHQTIEGVTSTGATGTGKLVFDGTPTLVTPVLGTPTSGTLTNCTGLPISGLVASTVTALGVGSIELGAASDTTIARVSAGVASVEGNTIVVNTSSPTLGTITTTGTIELGNASDTTLSRSSAGVLAVEGVVVDTISASNTLTNKTLTTPTITKPVMNATNPTAQTYSPAGAGTATLDLSLANQHFITMPAGNITIALSNDTNNQVFYVSILQDGTGSRTVTWFTTIRWAGGVAPTLTTTASKRDAFIFVRTGSGTYDGFIVGQNI